MKNVVKKILQKFHVTLYSEDLVLIEHGIIKTPAIV